jgi:flagellar motor switch protein FliN
MAIEHETFEDEAKTPGSETEGEATTPNERSVEATRQVPLEVSIVMGRSRMKVSQILKLARGSVIELDRHIGDPVEIMINETLVARGELVEVPGGRVGINLTEMVKQIITDR